MSSRMRLKAATFRTYIRILTEDGRREAVRALVPPETAALMLEPPLSGSWMDLAHMHHIDHAVETLGGMAAVRDLARKGTDQARKPYMGVVEGVLKLFGTSPATLFKRMNTLVSSFVSGIDYRYTATGERSGTMVVAFDADHELPTSAFVGQIPTLQTLLDTCGVKGVVGAPERLGPQTARFHIQW
jgi:Protein of unknown function (DUF2378)